MLLTSGLCKGGVCIYYNLSDFKIEHDFRRRQSIKNVWHAKHVSVLFSL